MPQNPATVFVVEDDLDVCDSLQAIICAMGYVCHTFDSPSTLLTHWDTTLCDFLILDIDLPEYSGIDLLGRLQAIGNCPPAMFYSGNIDSRVRAAVASLGEIPILQKGTDSDELMQFLAKALPLRGTE